MTEYTVEFRIYGKELNQSLITNALNLEPSLIRKRGGKKGKNTSWEDGMWAYNGFPEFVGSKNWKSLEEGLTFILEKLLPVKDKVEEYQKDFRAVIWCGHFQTEVKRTFALSPRTLQMLSELELTSHSF